MEGPNRTEKHIHSVNMTESEKKTQGSGDSACAEGSESPVADSWPVRTAEDRECQPGAGDRCLTYSHEGRLDQS